MSKIKLERWKEVVRLEIIEGDYNSFLEDLLKWTYNDGIILICIFEDDDTARTNCIWIKGEIKHYNNSLKDGGYEWICKGCKYECKTKKEPQGLCNNLYEDTPTNFKEINNNKIEILE